MWAVPDHIHGVSVTTAHGSNNESDIFSRLIDSSNRTTYSRPNTIFITVVITIIAIVESATTLVVGPNIAGVSFNFNLLLRVAIRKGE